MYSSKVSYRFVLLHHPRVSISRNLINIVHKNSSVGTDKFECSPRRTYYRFRTSGHRKLHLRQHLRENPSLEGQLQQQSQQERGCTSAAALEATPPATLHLQMATTENSSLLSGVPDSGRRIIAFNPESNEEYELFELEELLAANPALAEQLQQQGTLSLALNATSSEQVICF